MHHMTFQPIKLYNQAVPTGVGFDWQHAIFQIYVTINYFLVLRDDPFNALLPVQLNFPSSMGKIYKDVHTAFKNKLNARNKGTK